MFVQARPTEPAAEADAGFGPAGTSGVRDEAAIAAAALLAMPAAQALPTLTQEPILVSLCCSLQSCHDLEMEHANVHLEACNTIA